MQVQLYAGATIRLADETEAVVVGGVMTNDEKTLILVEDGRRRRQWVKFTTGINVVDAGSIQSASADRTTGDRVKGSLIRRLIRD